MSTSTLRHDNHAHPGTSEIVEPHVACPDCGSSDAMCVYDDGHTYCFSCEKVNNENTVKEHTKKPKANKELIPQANLEFTPLKNRQLTQKTCQKLHYTVSKYKGKPVQVATYFDDQRNPIGQKLRFKDKSFAVLGQMQNRFYGQHLWANGGKMLVVTEGEIDALTVSQVGGNKYPVVSLPNGAQSAKKVFNAQLDWLNLFETVVIMFDMDEPGRKAADSVLGLLPLGKLKVASLPHKDPNECLLQGQADEILKAMWNAKEYKPDGIVNGSDLWEDLVNDTSDEIGHPYPWDIDLQDKTGGVYKRELVVLTAGTGTGKSTFVKQLAHHLGVNLNLKVGMLMLEESVKKTAHSLMSLAIGKKIKRGKPGITEAEYKEAFDKALGTGRFVFYKHFGSLERDSLINKIRYMTIVEKCDFIILDHITIAISGLDIQDERKATDVLMTRLRSLVEETGVGLWVISHLKRVDGQPAEEGGKISLSHLRGSQGLSQLSDLVLALERDQQAKAERVRNTTRVRILKGREEGETGIAGRLRYNKAADTLEAVSREEAEEIEQEAEDDNPF